MGTLVIAGLTFPVAAIYLAPALIAHARRLPSASRVMAVDVLLGWTIIGWVVALSAACRKPTPGSAGPAWSGRDQPRRQPPSATPAGSCNLPASRARLPRLVPYCGRPETNVYSVWHSLN